MRTSKSKHVLNSSLSSSSVNATSSSSFMRSRFATPQPALYFVVLQQELPLLLRASMLLNLLTQVPLCPITILPEQIKVFVNLLYYNCRGIFIKKLPSCSFICKCFLFQTFLSLIFLYFCSSVAILCKEKTSRKNY